MAFLVFTLIMASLVFLFISIIKAKISLFLLVELKYFCNYWQSWNIFVANCRIKIFGGAGKVKISWWCWQSWKSFAATNKIEISL